MNKKAQIINTVGLGLVVGGCLLLYCFGLPPQVNPSGESLILLEKKDEAQIAKGKRYGWLGRFGIFLVAIGSALQIWATWA
jgi:uncharacterized protein YjeT (DUF2065 family)